MTIPLLEWCEARIEARSLVINALLPLLHMTPAGERASAAWRRILEREMIYTTHMQRRPSSPPDDAGTSLVELARQLSAAL
jgi:hypothetical protein